MDVPFKVHVLYYGLPLNVPLSGHAQPGNRGFPVLASLLAPGLPLPAGRSTSSQLGNANCCNQFRRGRFVSKAKDRRGRRARGNLTPRVEGSSKRQVPQDQEIHLPPRLHRLARLVLGNDHEAELWYVSPQPGLGDRRPIDIACSESGVHEIENLLLRIEYSVYS